MDDYDNKSLRELKDISITKYGLDLPPTLNLADAINWLRFQDTTATANTITNVPELTVSSPLNNPNSPKPIVIPTIEGIEHLSIEGENLPIIAPVVPNTTYIPSLPVVPTIPTITGAKFMVPTAPKFYLNDENTLRALHGAPQLPWDTDLGTLNAARNQEHPLASNPNASFQTQVLHPNYRPVVPINIPAFNTLTPIPVINTLVSKPTTPSIPDLAKIVSPPKITPISPPKVISPPKAPNIQFEPQSPPHIASPPRINIQTQPINVIPTINQTVGVPTMAPTIKVPTMAPTVGAPTMAPTVGAPTMAPTVKVPTVGVPTMAPTVKVPTMPPTVGVPTMAPAVKVPTMPPTVGVPTIPPTVGVPTMAPAVKVPTMPPTVGAPTMAPAVKVPTMPPTVGAPTMAPTVKVPTVKVPTVGVPAMAPAVKVPTVGVPAMAPAVKVPTVGVPAMAPAVKVPTVGVPTMAPKVGVPAMAPKVGVPAMAPKVGVPTMAPKVGVPTMGPKVGVPTMAPKVGVPTIGVPTVGVPSINRPITPQMPVTQEYKTLNLQIKPQQTIPKVPGMITLNIGPVTPRTPKSESMTKTMTAMMPIIQQAPISPGFQAGPQVGGFTTVRSTTLAPNIPNVFQGQRNQVQTMINKTPTIVPTIKMPTFNTIVNPVVIKTPKRPTNLPIIEQGQRPQTVPGTTDNIMRVLNEIDPDLLVSERTGKNKKGYSREILKNFAEGLGLTASGKRKQEIIEDIQNVRREMGLI